MNTSTDRSIPEVLRELLSTGSLSRTARRLQTTERELRETLYRLNNLSTSALVRFTDRQGGDAVEVTGAGRACLSAEIRALFRSFLDEPAISRGRFMAFHRRRVLLERLQTRSGAPNCLYGHVRAFRFAGGRLDIEMDIGAGQQVIVSIDPDEGRRLDLAVGMECGLLIEPDAVRLMDTPPLNGSGNALAAIVLAAPVPDSGQVVLGLCCGKRLIAGARGAEAPGPAPGALVWACISTSRIALAADPRGGGREYAGSSQSVPADAGSADIPSLRGSAMQASTFTYDSLMRHARKPGDFLTRALAGAIASAAAGLIEAPNLALGLSRPRFAALLSEHFPGMESGVCACGEACAEGCRPLRADEFQDLVELLLAHRSDNAEATEWLAYAIASACMGGNHLYQDIGLPDRQALSDLLRRRFTRLFEKNAGNMKWKKFFYKQLCDQAQVNVCQAPSCQVCDDYWNCFGPEDDSFPANLAALAGRAPAGR